MNLIDIMPALEKPFPVAEIDFLPKKAFEKDGQTIAPGLPFADPRAYEDRLNAVCPGEWSTATQIVIAGDKLVAVVTVTILGVPHANVGEAPLSSENAATEARAQAFKRACSEFGLGRYLYGLPKQFIAWDKANRRFALSRNEKLQLVKAMYKKAGLLPSAQTSAPQPPASEPASDSPATQEQLATIGQLARAAQKYVNRPKTFSAAQELIQQLQAS